MKKKTKKTNNLSSKAKCRQHVTAYFDGQLVSKDHTRLAIREHAKDVVEAKEQRPFVIATFCMICGKKMPVKKILEQINVEVKRRLEHDRLQRKMEVDDA